MTIVDINGQLLLRRTALKYYDNVLDIMEKRVFAEPEKWRNGAIAEYPATHTLHKSTALVVPRLTHQCVFAPLSRTPEVE